MSYCPRHDPIIAVGFMQCPKCKAIAYPTEAEWVDATQILASFPRTCTHTRAGVFLCDTALPRRVVRDPARFVAGRRCAGVRSDGEPCRAYARPGVDYCASHGGQAG